MMSNLLGLLEKTTLLSSHPQAHIKKIRNSWLYFSGLQHPSFNGVFCDTANITDLDLYFSELVNFFSDRNVPFIWWWCGAGPVPDKMRERLLQYEFFSSAASLGVSVDIENVKYVSTSDFISIQEVSTDQEYETFIAILAKNYQFTDEMKLGFSDMFDSSETNIPIKHYIGFYKNEPVATISSYSDEDSIGIYCGSTLAHVRQQGLFTALSQHVIRQGKLNGCKRVVAQLDAPNLILEIAEKLGFSVCCQFQAFIKLPPKPLQ